MIDKLIKRLKIRTVITPNGCWELQGLKDKDGYGRIWWCDRMYHAHRLSAYISLGLNLRDGTQANHKCNNRACWNWSHLYIGTQKDNNRDTVKDGNHVSGWTLR